MKAPLGFVLHWQCSRYSSFTETIPFFSYSPALHRSSLGTPMSDYELFVPSRLHVIDGPCGPGRRARFTDESAVIFWEIEVKRKGISEILYSSDYFCHFCILRKYSHFLVSSPRVFPSSPPSPLPSPALNFGLTSRLILLLGVLLPLGSLEAASPLAILSDGSQGKNPVPSCWARV